MNDFHTTHICIALNTPYLFRRENTLTPHTAPNTQHFSIYRTRSTKRLPAWPAAVYLSKSVSEPPDPGDSLRRFLLAPFIPSTTMSSRIAATTSLLMSGRNSFTVLSAAEAARPRPRARTREIEQRSAGRGRVRDGWDPGWTKDRDEATRATCRQLREISHVDRMVKRDSAAAFRAESTRPLFPSRASLRRRR